MKLVLSKTKAIDFRVSTLPTLFGEKVVVRILDSAGVEARHRGAGLRARPAGALMHAIGRPYGMILATGPTGSGKTVSLYTCLNILNQPGVNISTAEDPAEIQLPGVNQVNINEKAGLTFATALRAFLRQDPDIIMVGEIRDLETAEIAIKAAQTGHLRAVDAAHQRRAVDADAARQHGRGAVQRRLVGDPDHRAAARPPAVPEMQGARRTSRPRRCCGPASPKRTSTARGSRTRTSAASIAATPATRAASASTR